jgi:hypothetical protein
MPSEKQLDQDLDTALRNDARFLAWFVSRLSRGASYPIRHWSRANYAWGKVKVMLPNTTTGALEFVPREGETDVLLVLEGADGRRLGVHIENKLASGSFTPFQPEVCTARAEAWVGNPRYESYHEWETVLLAPQAFYDRNEPQARKFTTFISHEEVGKWLPSFLSQ